MRGVRRIFFAGMAAALRFVARAPLGIAHGIDAIASRCEELSR